jgi:hypothetical protein
MSHPQTERRAGFLLVQTPTIMLAGAAGIWLFYVEHQFEDVYWESSAAWSYADAALRGSSYLKLPKVLQFFSGNIGFHHVHHLSARIPSYNLPRAHHENPMFHSVTTVSMTDGLRAVRLKLYDQDHGRMVSFAQARANSRGKHGPVAERWTPEASNARHASPRRSAAASAESLGRAPGPAVATELNRMRRGLGPYNPRVAAAEPCRMGARGTTS